MRKQLVWLPVILIGLGGIACFVLMASLGNIVNGESFTTAKLAARMGLALVLAAFTCYMGFVTYKRVIDNFVFERWLYVVGLGVIMFFQFMFTFVDWYPDILSGLNDLVHYGYNWTAIICAAITMGIVLNVDDHASRS